MVSCNNLTTSDGSCVVATERGIGGKGEKISMMAAAMAVMGGALILWIISDKIADMRLSQCETRKCRLP